MTVSDLYSPLEATLTSVRIIHPSFGLNCLTVMCIEGNLGPIEKYVDKERQHLCFCCIDIDLLIACYLLQDQCDRSEILNQPVVKSASANVKLYKPI